MALRVAVNVGCGRFVALMSGVAPTESKVGGGLVETVSAGDAATQAEAINDKWQMTNAQRIPSAILHFAHEAVILLITDASTTLHRVTHLLNDVGGARFESVNLLQPRLCRLTIRCRFGVDAHGERGGVHG